MKQAVSAYNDRAASKLTTSTGRGRQANQTTLDTEILITKEDDSHNQSKFSLKRLLRIGEAKSTLDQMETLSKIDSILDDEISRF